MKSSFTIELEVKSKDWLDCKALGMVKEIQMESIGGS